MGVYLEQETQEVKVPDLELPNKVKKDNNQSDTEFDMEVFEWKENKNTVLIRKHNIELVKKIYNRCSPTNSRRPSRLN